MKIKTEIELCQKFVDAHPRREHLYFEVQVMGGRADIIHKEHNIVTIYEAKLRLGIDVLEQCIERKRYANFVYAVVPPNKIKNGFLQKLFEDYGIGIISICDEGNFNGRKYLSTSILREYNKPIFNRHPEKITLYEESKKEIAGSQSAGVTSFSIMVDAIKRSLIENDNQPIEKIFNVQSHYGTLKQFKTNIYQWIRAGVIKGIEMENGKMRIKR